MLAAMDGNEHPARRALRAARDRTIEVLSEAFARDELGLDEFERRLDSAYACTVTEELDALTQDLSAASPRTRDAAQSAHAQGNDAPLAPAPPAPLVAHSAAAPIAFRAILGSVERSGAFALAPNSQVLALLGNVELDLREVVLHPGVTELHVRSILGNVEITVPPTLAVECVGEAILGAFETTQRVPPVPDPDRPLLRVRGSAFLGNVEIRTRIRRGR